MKRQLQLLIVVAVAAFVAVLAIGQGPQSAEALKGDTDGDGFTDIQEIIFGSDYTFAGSTPESWTFLIVFTNLACFDGVDNDLDGLVDFGGGGDPGCTDSDSDFFEDPVEALIGSLPGSAASTPEDTGFDSATLVFGSCVDTADNDGDGSADLLDPGCAPLPDKCAQPWDWVALDCFGPVTPFWHWETLATVVGKTTANTLAYNYGCDGVSGTSGCTYDTGLSPNSGRAESPDFGPIPATGATLSFKIARDTEDSCGDSIDYDVSFVLYSIDDGGSYSPLDLSAGSISAGGQYLAAGTGGEICGADASFQEVTGVPLPAGTTNVAFDFDTVDEINNGTAGVFIDDVAILLNDIDGDGCPNVKEQQTAVGSQTSGGLRDYLNPYDYFNPTNDGLNRIDDIIAVVNRTFSIGDPTAPINQIPPAPPAYHAKFDREPLGPNVWNLTQGSGQILISDILASVKQFFHDCGTGIVKVP